ncbi:MAG: hypothetical protein K0Q49_1785 [Haloplasmataceae bacterium]|nr:hypothetical protein [Haloplasmataceae bacterium]
MNNKIVLKTKDGKVIFKGNILDIPIKKDYIIQKSIEIFNDDDPCIIHKSFVIKKVVDELLNHTNLKNKNQINVSDFKEYFHFLDIKEPDCVISLGDE